MRDLRPVRDARTRSPGLSLVLGLTLVATGAVGCVSDTASPAGPVVAEASGPAEGNAEDGNAIVVSNSAELIAALSADNSGRRIRVLAGSYSITQPLTVPDKVTLEGEGVMLFDAEASPTGFASDTRTTLTMTANTPGNILTLGDGVTVRGLAIQELAGRVGNPIAVVSRGAGDRVSVTIDEVEIMSPNTHSIVPSGPTGCGVAVFTLNPNLGMDPPAHDGAAVASRITRSLIRSPAPGTACGIFAFNFASDASVSVALEGNVIGGGIIGNGGVSRPDAVHDSRVAIQSRRNLYRNDGPSLCAPRLGWNLQGGSGTPVPLQIAATERNALRLHSVDDRIEGFTTAVSASGGRRFFAAPTAGPTTGNSVDLQLIGTTLATPSCGGASFVADFRLAGAAVSGTSLVPGDGNTLRAVIRGVTGSGSRSNVYADVLGSSGPIAPAFQGTGNRLEIIGSPRAFEQTNQAIDPAPGFQFFTGGGQ